MRYVALLRGINVGGNKLVAMADLRRLGADLGFGDVRTLLQSGNVVFDAGKRRADAIREAWSTGIAKHLQVACDVIVRAADEWHGAIAGNPFTAEAQADPGRMIVVFLDRNATAAGVEAVQKAIVGRERVKGDGAHLYAVYPDGMGTSKLTLSVIEKALGARGTARNWNTTLKLAQLLDDAAGRKR